MKKISYKLYLNERLKKVSFFGRQTYPLYVQVIFERKPIFFKSHYFDLLSNPDRILSIPGVTVKGPTLNQIIQKEEEVIEFIISQSQDVFSLERFKMEYDFYSEDLCQLTQDKFLEYLRVFFQDKGMPTLATVINEGSRHAIPYDAVQDMKQALTNSLYQELLENSIYYAPPYLPLCGFMRHSKDYPMRTLSVLDWQSQETQTAFDSYIRKYYRKENQSMILQQVNNWIENRRQELLG